MKALTISRILDISRKYYVGGCTYEECLDEMLAHDHNITREELETFVPLYKKYTKENATHDVTEVSDTLFKLLIALFIETNSYNVYKNIKSMQHLKGGQTLVDVADCINTKFYKKG
jgi:hypothetical protein